MRRGRTLDCPYLIAARAIPSLFGRLFRTRLWSMCGVDQRQSVGSSWQRDQRVFHFSPKDLFDWTAAVGLFRVPTELRSGATGRRKSLNVIFRRFLEFRTRVVAGDVSTFVRRAVERALVS